MKTANIVLTAIGAAFATMTVVGLIKKPSSVYKSEPSERNPVEGKRVRFVESDTDPINADGKRGHLEAAGTSDHHAGVYEKVFKRAFDIVLSGFGLILLSPLFVALSLWIIVDDPGPVLFTQKRVGRDKQYFRLHKFRSMRMSTPHDVPTHQLENPEQWITKSGKFMRSHSLDELPQIWDIWIGERDIIGTTKKNLDFMRFSAA